MTAILQSIIRNSTVLVAWWFVDTCWIRIMTIPVCWEGAEFFSLYLDIIIWHEDFYR